MLHETALISTMAVGFAYAVLGGYVAAWMRLPSITGYLLAGIAVGPFSPGFIADVALGKQLAEIGVMLLMFGVGMKLSVRDLLAVRRIVLPGAVIQIAAATGLGIAAAYLWGWSLGAGLVFGLALSVASTVVVLRALHERGILTSEDGRIAIGWLIVEDLLMVLALVLLPAFALALGGRPLGGMENTGAESLMVGLGLTLGKVVVFVLLMLLVGARLLPWLLERVARIGSEELFTLAVVAAALGIAFGASSLFGVSAALGAFLAGIVINESDHSHRATSELRSLQEIFGVLFFVSIGMLFDPTTLLREPLQVLGAVAIVIIGKALIAFAIVLAFGRTVNTAVIIAASLAQIGEFSFIVAELGISLDLLPPSGRDLVLAAALVSITLNPLLFRAAAYVSARAARRAAHPCDP